jgi:ribonuclease BN (tRNA processing enzyme)
VGVSPGLSLTVLGCSGSYPSAECPCSGYLISYGDTHLAVDLGPGCLSNLQHHIELPELTGVVLSHAHPDHWVDLTGLHVALKYRFGREEVPVWGTAENRGMALLVTGAIEPTFDWKVTGDGDDFAVGPLRVRLDRTDHYVETHAVRIDAPDGSSLVYSADTGPDWSLDHFAHGVDLALVEATYGTDSEAKGIKHLSARQAGTMARSASARRLVLTHMWPGSDPRVHARNGAEAYGAPVTIAAPHERYAL